MGHLQDEEEGDGGEVLREVEVIERSWVHDQNGQDGADGEENLEEVRSCQLFEGGGAHERIHMPEDHIRVAKTHIAILGVYG